MWHLVLSMGLLSPHPLCGGLSQYSNCHVEFLFWYPRYSLNSSLSSGQALPCFCCLLLWACNPVPEFSHLVDPTSFGLILPLDFCSIFVTSVTYHFRYLSILGPYVDHLSEPWEVLGLFPGTLLPELVLCLAPVCLALPWEDSHGLSVSYKKWWVLALSYTGHWWKLRGKSWVDFWWHSLSSQGCWLWRQHMVFCCYCCFN